MGFQMKPEHSSMAERTVQFHPGRDGHYSFWDVTQQWEYDVGLFARWLNKTALNHLPIKGPGI
jgi:hypothetical protein